MRKDSSWVVVKYGGTSVSSRGNWETIAENMRRLVAADQRPLVVCSALSGVSDSLQRLIDSSTRGEHEKDVEALLALHMRFADELGVDGKSIIADEMEQIFRLSQGAALVEEASPALQARMMSIGEMISTKLGAAFLASQGMDVGWCDARELLTAVPLEHAPLRKRFLSATCPFEDDPELRERLASRPEKVLLTQGFIASDEQGRTVLLGRGGSDTSASYLATKLGAERLEIWADVPGMFSANPHQVPSARLLKRLDYDEAQELASMGAKVLHPRCIPPARSRSIPIHLRCTPYPEMEGTVIVEQSPDEKARVKAISAKKGVTVVSMDTLGMWQQVGFLSDVFAVFKKHGLSVDLVATSESNVTVTLDPAANLLGSEVKDRLLSDLDEVCTASLKDDCAVVSLVGRDIRSILSKLTPAMEVFEEHNVHLVSQAASDLNISLVVDEEQIDRLVKNLHAMLLAEEHQDAVLGPRWSSLSPDEDSNGGISTPWWKLRRAELCRIGEERGAAFVYDAATLERQARSLLEMKSVDRIFYAMKANSNEEVLRRLESLGMGFECVSAGEIRHLQALFGDCGGRLLFTPNFAPKSEYELGFEAGAMVTLDNLHPVNAWPEVFEGREVLVRVDPGRGRGHHRYVRTAGYQSKFGVCPEELPDLAKTAEKLGMRVKGLHAHVGSGVQHIRTWSDIAAFLESFCELFPSADVLDLGGGLAVPERYGQAQIDIDEIDKTLGRFKAAHPSLELWLEPGRYIVSEAGVLLSRVTQLKTKGSVHYVGIETGMNSLIRPALYGAHHRIANLTRLGEKATEHFDVVGPICESGDVLGHGRRLPQPREGDVMVIANAGAYGRVMSSEYNLREPAKEIMLEP